ncbi:hypothetical protein NCR96_03380 [Helicobacter sp. 14348-15]|uniref:hypothetical protein n=1 Tax=Helicobacter colisuis TaxID=2949739 RepID=UPI00202B71E2|nr:hypothetical protein [Helicobacter colisuis]MCL9820784.1 hypothetical protein [Helicobacter colisuis]
MIGIIFFNQNKMTNEASMSLNSVIEQEVEQKIKLATDSMAYSLGELVGGGGEFIRFEFSKPLPNGELIQAQKIGYAQMIPNTNNMWISTGVYIDTYCSNTNILAIMIDVL